MSAPKRAWIKWNKRSATVGAPSSHGPVTPGTEAGYILATPEALAAAPEVRKLFEDMLPDDIEIYRAIKRSGARKRVDIARAILAAIRNRKETT